MTHCTRTLKISSTLAMTPVGGRTASKLEEPVAQVRIGHAKGPITQFVCAPVYESVGACKEIAIVGQVSESSACSVMWFDTVVSWLNRELCDKLQARLCRDRMKFGVWWTGNCGAHRSALTKS